MRQLPLSGPTYCHLLWDSAFIDQHGDVYACCHSAPGVLGNIGRAEMSSIWTNSGPLAAFREQSASGHLRCAVGCNILSAEEKAGVHRPPIYPEHPKNIWLLWGELCNIGCIMCPQDHRSKIMLDAAVLQRNVDWDRVQDVEIQGGEIFAMKGAKDFYLWLTSARAKKVNVITNGLLLTESWADHMVRTSNWIQVSVNAASKSVHEVVNAGSKFERVVENLRMLVRAKRRESAPTATIYKYTIVPENVHELADAVLCAQDLECDQIAFGYDHAVPQFLAANPDRTRRLRTILADLLAQTLPITIERKRLRQLGLIDS
jgi:MoaA/NifB/PqqE/SkfB family radical SAM enzyme